MPQLTLFADTEPVRAARPKAVPVSPSATALQSLLARAAFQPRDYQQRIVQQVCDHFVGESVDSGGVRQRAARSVMLESPTGSGKTLMGLCVAHVLQQAYGYRCCWVAMRRNLLSQADRENRNHGINADVAFLSLFAREAPPELVNRGNRPLLLIVDEAQHDPVDSAARLHHELRPQKVLGLTATPFRTDRLKLVFERVVRDMGIQELIDAGYLSRYQHYTVPAWDPRRVADLYAAEPQRWGQSLMFFMRREDCQACQQALAEQGISSELVTAESDRDRQLQDFESGRVQVLISMRVLTEGFDCPSLRTVFCRPSGRLCVTQMAGRVFRQHPNIIHKQIVQCEQTQYPFTRTARPTRQYLWSESGWRTLDVNPSITDVSRRCLAALARVQQRKLPRYLTRHRKKRNQPQSEGD